jgi:hypothetical protein
MSPLPPGHRDTVKRHWKGTPAYVVANVPPCLALRDQATLPKGRRFEAAAFRDLGAIRPPKSWAMAVILCPGDTLAEVAAWAVRHKVQDGNRFLFFHAPGVDLRAALEPWRAAGYPLPLLVEAERWLDMARLLGQHLNNTILRDHTPPGWPT